MQHGWRRGRTREGTISPKPKVMNLNPDRSQKAAESKGMHANGSLRTRVQYTRAHRQEESNSLHTCSQEATLQGVRLHGSWA